MSNSKALVVGQVIRIVRVDPGSEGDYKVGDLMTVDRVFAAQGDLYANDSSGRLWYLLPEEYEAVTVGDDSPAQAEEPAPDAERKDPLAAGRALHEAVLGPRLRDEFAGRALAALVAEPRWGNTSSATRRLLEDRDPGDEIPLADRFAIAAYMLADAMLRAREVQS